MRDRNLHTILVALLLSALVAGCATMTIPEPGSSAPAMTAPVAKAAASGPQEGIKVHGNWVIEVKNPYGTLAERREFKNALLSQGRAALALFLGRKNSVGKWQIDVGSTTFPAPCDPVPCLIQESGSGFGGSRVYSTLTVDVPTSGANAYKLVFTGTATALANSQINSVSTILFRCTVDVSGCVIGTTAMEGQQDFTGTVFALL